jgi:hypothetical protein
VAGAVAAVREQASRELAGAEARWEERLKAVSGEAAEAAVSARRTRSRFMGKLE